MKKENKTYTKHDRSRSTTMKIRTETAKNRNGLISCSSIENSMIVENVYDEMIPQCLLKELNEKKEHCEKKMRKKMN